MVKDNLKVYKSKTSLKQGDESHKIDQFQTNSSNQLEDKGSEASDSHAFSNFEMIDAKTLMPNNSIKIKHHTHKLVKILESIDEFAEESISEQRYLMD